VRGNRGFESRVSGDSEEDGLEVTVDTKELSTFRASASVRS